MSRTKVRFQCPRSRSQSGQWSNMPKFVLLIHYRRKFEQKLHRKIKHNEKVYVQTILVPTPKVKVAIRSEIKVVSQQ